MSCVGSYLAFDVLTVVGAVQAGVQAPPYRTDGIGHGPQPTGGGSCLQITPLEICLAFFSKIYLEVLHVDLHSDTMVFSTRRSKIKICSVSFCGGDCKSNMCAGYQFES